MTETNRTWINDWKGQLPCSFYVTGITDRYRSRGPALDMYFHRFLYTNYWHQQVCTCFAISVLDENSAATYSYLKTSLDHPLPWSHISVDHLSDSTKQQDSEIKWRPGRATNCLILGIELNHSHPGLSIAQEAYSAGSYIVLSFISLGYSLAYRGGGCTGQNEKLNACFWRLHCRCMYY